MTVQLRVGKVGESSFVDRPGQRGRLDRRQLRPHVGIHRVRNHLAIATEYGGVEHLVVFSIAPNYARHRGTTGT
jgi:hypothetical protein